MKQKKAAMMPKLAEPIDEVVSEDEEDMYSPAQPNTLLI
jgi:hypothetical protein